MRVRDGFVQVRKIYLNKRLHVAKMYETAAAKSETEALHCELWALARLESLWVCNHIAFKTTQTHVNSHKTSSRTIRRSTLLS